MFNWKKYFSEELLQVALLLSLLRIDRRSFYHYDAPSAIGVTDGWEPQSSILVRRGDLGIHPKDIPYGYEQRDVFNDFSYSSIFRYISANDVTAYLYSLENGTQNASPVSVLYPTTSESSGVSSASTRTAERVDLSPEDLDIIETLWKYDLHVDQNKALDGNPGTSEQAINGTPPDDPHIPANTGPISPELPNPFSSPFFTNSTSVHSTEDRWSNRVPVKEEPRTYDDFDGLYSDPFLGSALLSPSPSSPGPSSSTRSDLPTSTRRLKSENKKESCCYNDQKSRSPSPLSSLLWSDLNLDEAFLNDVASCALWDSWSSTSVKKEENTDNTKKEEEEEKKENKDDLGIEADFLDFDEFDLFDRMIHAPQAHHPRPLQGRGLSPYMRSMGMEHRWQDFSSGFLPPDPGHSYHHHHYHHHHPHSVSSNYGSSSMYSSHHHQLNLSHPALAGSSFSSSGATTSADIGATEATSSYPPLLGGNYALGTTVANSMHLTNGTTHESMPVVDGVSSAPQFKMESDESSVYPYQTNCTAEMGHSTEGFFSSILNDEDLQLMDMAVNEGMYTARSTENNCTGGHICIERNTDSDSAVSSMGSERVPSLSSDTEWMETNSDSGHTSTDHFSSDHCSKYRCYDSYMYGHRIPNIPEANNNTSSRVPGPPQKKYQLYGRRYFQEQQNTGFRPIDHIAHNHTYHLPQEAVNSSSSLGSTVKTCTKEKNKKSGRKEEESLTRDEKRARNLSVPISVYDIINLPMDEFNERLSKYDLSETQLSLIRDIRRRGKNKVAAQNCRKRKLDQIMSLADEVKQMKDKKHRLLTERDFLLSEKQRVQSLYSQLYRHVFQSLRDPDGNPYNPYEYSLQQSSDGSVILVPRNSTSLSSLDIDHHHNTRTKNKDTK